MQTEKAKAAAAYQLILAAAYQRLAFAKGAIDLDHRFLVYLFIIRVGDELARHLPSCATASSVVHEITRAHMLSPARGRPPSPATAWGVCDTRLGPLHVTLLLRPLTGTPPELEPEPEVCCFQLPSHHSLPRPFSARLVPQPPPGWVSR